MRPTGATEESVRDAAISKNVRVTDSDSSSLWPLVRRDLLIGLVGAVVVWGLVNVAVIATSSRTTYSACNPDKSTCVMRHESWRVPGFRHKDGIQVGDGSGTCGDDYPTPFKPSGLPTFLAKSVVLHGSGGQAATYPVGVC